MEKGPKIINQPKKAACEATDARRGMRQRKNYIQKQQINKSNVQRWPTLK